MNGFRTILFFALAAALGCGAASLSAQQSFTQRFAAHNSQMAALQPAWVTPLVECDPRLLQYARASFSNSWTAEGTQTVNYGNGRGMGVIAGNRFVSRNS